MFDAHEQRNEISFWFGFSSHLSGLDSWWFKEKQN